MNRISRLVALGAAAALAASGPAFAHAELVRSNPVSNATVKSPRTITLTFSEKVVPQFSKFELTMPAHNMKIPVTTTVSPDGKRIVGRVPSTLMKGSYTIAWTAAGSDGHKLTGKLGFKVG